ncbi:MAG: site-2 protease family protein [Planctomycetaceae bacterium]|nr:site-2 protease family protein [Planctomycetaceae bacterium]
MCLNSLSTLTLLAATGDEPTTLAWIGNLAWMIFSVGAGLGFVIFVHELGHFLVAKACGVKCDKFYIGFDVPMPKVFGWQIPSKLLHFQWGETEYGIGILPLGGYVKMLGQDDDPRNAEAEAERMKVKTESGETKLDPRSYPAKSVPARMAIISAGVIMNLIFAVIMATIAYRFGVPEMPAVIGGTLPASPAWTTNIQPGDKVLQFGRSGEPYEFLRWEDLMREVVLNGTDQDLDILIQHTDGRRDWHVVRPSDRFKAVNNRPTLGVIPQRTREVHLYAKAAAYLNFQSDVPLEERDEIVAVEGKRIDADYQLTELLAVRFKEPLKVTVSRVEKTDGQAPSETGKRREFDVVIQPRPMREVGLVMKIGPVAQVRENSPAKVAGFLPGDVITSIDGEPVGDPLTLGQRLVPTGDSPAQIEFEVTRIDSNGKPITKNLPVVRELPRQFQNTFPNGGPASIESIGLAFEVTAEVVSVDSGSPADKAGLRAGDRVVEAQFMPASEAAREQEDDAIGLDKPFDPIVLDNTMKNWSFVVSRMQGALPETKVKLTWLRGDKRQSSELPTVLSKNYYDEQRGLSFYGKKRIRHAENWTSAVGLGFRETTDRLREVLRVLTSLATLRLSPSNLSGPAGIIYAAGSFASEGVPMLLIFLTLLSANLAVLNFLPIPALDGGHMMFLAAEWIRGKPVDEKLQIRLTIAGVLCLLSLMVFATMMDIGRFLG